MNILGMGSFELLIVLLVAFIFLGPTKMIETARNIGKLLKNAKDMAKDFQEVILDEENLSTLEKSPDSQTVNDLNSVKFNSNNQAVKNIGKDNTKDEDNKIE